MSSQAIEGFRISPQQRRIAQLLPGNLCGPYHTEGRVFVGGSVDEPRLRRALESLVARHEILRTRFVTPTGMTLPLQVIDELERAGSIADLNGELSRERTPAIHARCEPQESGGVVLSLRMPAQCVDGGSFARLVQELAELYRGAELDEPYQYADAAEWQNELLDSDDTASGREFWTSQHPPQPVRLPNERVDAIAPFQPQSLAAAVETDLPARIAALATTRGVRSEAVLLAVLQSLVGRLAGVQAPAVAVCADGRHYDELRDAVGLFERWLPVSAELAPETSWTDLLAAVDRNLSAALSHQDYFAWELFDLPSANGGPPYCPVAFRSEAATATFVAGGATWQTLETASFTDRFSLCLEWRPHAAAQSLVWWYDASRWDRAAVARIVEEYATLLACAIAAPDRRLEEMPIVGPDERRELLAVLSGVDRPSPTSEARVLHGWFERWAAEHPERPAVECQGAALTYGELNARANRAADRLRSLGAGPEVRIAVSCGRSIDLVVAVLAALKSGGSYVPIDPAYPAERMRYLIDDCAASIVLTDRAGAAQWRDRSARCVMIEDAAADLAIHVDNPPAPAPQHAAYLIYTSGSTGKPKGTVIEHRQATASTARRLDYYRRPVERSVLLPSFAFDSSVAVIFGTLSAGGQLVIPPEGVERDAAALATLVAQRRITHWLSVPSLYALLLEQPAADLSSLRTVVVAGEACSTALVATHFAALPACELFNEYGPTEAAVWSTVQRIAADDAAEGVPIGRPLPGTTAYVLDERLSLVPRGAAGELFIGGDGVARGYLGRPELTAARFLPDAFAPPGGRMYRTGDRVRFREDGALEFLGRIDHQVKVRGYRIELGEVEAALAEHPLVREVAVAARPINGDGASAEWQLTAYTAGSADRVPQSSELRAFLRERLPEYMLPAAWVALDRLPRTPHGKVDYSALPSGGQPALRTEFVPPQTATERRLAAWWQDLLQISHAGRDDRFVDLGGHSLVATRLMTRIRDEWQVAIPLRRLFDGGTLADVAAAIDAARGTASPRDADGPELQSLGLSRARLAPAQRGLWFLSQLVPESPVYNVCCSVRMTGALNRTALEAALTEIVRRHAVLRTRIVVVEGTPFQQIEPPFAVKLTVCGLNSPVDSEAISRGPATPAGETTNDPTLARRAGSAEASSVGPALHLAARERLLKQRSREQAAEPFDPQRAPWFRAELVALGEHDHALLMTVHHLAVDLWSTGLLLKELAALYGEQTGGVADVASVPNLTVQYTDFAEWQHAWLESPVAEASRVYWREELADVPALLELPTDRPRPTVQSFRGDVIRFTLSPALTARLHEFARARQRTVFGVLLAAYSSLLHRLSEQSLFAIFSPVATRNRPELEHLLGYFLNTLFFRCDFQSDPSFADVVDAMHRRSLEALEHNQLPADELLDALQTPRRAGAPPFSQAGFALLNAPLERLELPGLQLTRCDEHNGTAKADLTLLFWDDPEGPFSGLAEFSTDLFDRNTIERWLAAFTAMLEAALERPAEKVSRLPMMSFVERARLLAASREPLDRVAPFQSIVQRFADWTAANPLHPALVYRGRSISYGELDELSDRVAARLQERRLGREALVGVLLERSPESLAAALGIWKAGAAYLPLDPAAPQKRQERLIADSGVALILTERALQHRCDVGACDSACIAEWFASPACGSTHRNSVGPRDLAYVIYTSGSTGQPKGVEIEHGGLANFVDSLAETFELDRSARVLHFASVSFDASIMEWCIAFGVGATLVIAEEDDRLSPDRLTELMHAQAVDAALLPPTLLAILDPQRLPQFAAVISGGEECPADTAARWSHGRRFFNAYGPTEGTVWATVERVRNASKSDDDGAVSLECHAGTSNGRTPSIGSAVRGCETYVVDRRLELLPPDVPGELLIGGMGLARGYRGRPDLTALGFVPHPFQTIGQSRLYRTGDRVRRHADGRFEFLGRLDRQVKLRGFRIELGEVEFALQRQPHVADAVAVVRRDARGTPQLTAYLVPVRNGQFDVAAVRAAVTGELPYYMVPSAFAVLEALPRTASGKVDPARLPEPEVSTPILGAADEPQSEVEASLLDCFATALDRSTVGRHDNFFELGGDSILALRVVSHAARFGLSFGPREIFEHQTVAELAGHVTISNAAGDDEVAPGPVPLSPIQRWFFETVTVDRHHFNQAVVLEFIEPPDPALLTAAFSAILRHHDALRLRFVLQNGEWTQTLAAHSESDGAAAFQWVREAELPDGVDDLFLHTQSSMCLERGPLLRAVGVNRGPDRPALLLLAVHHLAIDAVSWGILLDDLTLAYEQARLGRRMVLPLKTTSYRTWSQRLYAAVQQVDGETAAAVWESLAGVETPTPVLRAGEAAAGLPTDCEAGPNDVQSARTVSLALSADGTARLLELAALTTPVAVQDVLLAAIVEVVARWSGQPSVRLWLESHGRSDDALGVNVARTVGWFTACHPVRFVAHSDPLKSLNSVTETLQRIPRRAEQFGTLRYLARDEIRRRLAAISAPEIAFNYLGHMAASSESSPARPSQHDPGPLRSGHQARNELFEVRTQIVAGELQVHWTYSIHRHTEATVARLAKEYLAEIQQIADAASTTTVPSTFVEAELSADELSAVFDELQASLGEET